MGIPSYFSFIMKNYKNIIKKREAVKVIHHLCMDCNSIIYDSFYDIEAEYNKRAFDLSTIEPKIIQLVIEKIEQLIVEISPEKTAFITFDGVAPFAKMNQQRKRRYKSSFMTRIPKMAQTIPSNDDKKIWNTTYITPGTQFMEMLSKKINAHFLSTDKLENIHYKINISCSDEAGEGEHKLFQWIRDTPLQEDTIAVYGLDSDLIMLSIFHKQFTDNIFVFREAPNFRNVLDDPNSIKEKEKEKLFMDIDKLSHCIFAEMGNTTQYNNIRVYDYIFICFLLGNDFLPHIISLNIRTIGIQMILDTYKNIIGKYQDRSLIHPITKDIQWKYVSIFINELSKKEHQNILQEHKIRDKFESWVWPNTGSKKDQDKIIENLPVIYRSEEKYISPKDSGWESRYYQSLFDIDYTNTEIYSICENYIEGLAWIFQYYTKGACNNQWSYKYHYAPLLEDLKKYIGKIDLTEIYKEKPMCSKEEQLKYVIPPDILSELFPNDITIKKTPIEYKLRWAYCRYLWEAHPLL